MLGLPNSEVGKALAEHWKLPAVLAQVISRHHALHAGLDFFPMVSAAHAANYLAHGLGLRDGYRSHPPKLSPKAL